MTPQEAIEKLSKDREVWLRGQRFGHSDAVKINGEEMISALDLAIAALEEKVCKSGCNQDSYSPFCHVHQTPSDIVQENIANAIRAERERLRKEIEKIHSTFWEDEDHAVGGYISRKDLKKILD